MRFKYPIKASLNHIAAELFQALQTIGATVGATYRHPLGLILQKSTENKVSSSLPNSKYKTSDSILKIDLSCEHSLKR